MALLVLALLVAGCGDDDEGGGDSGPAAQSTGAAPPEADSLRSCLTKAKLELKPGSEPATDAKGKTQAREGLEIADTTYLGYVQWPSKHLADVYLSKDEPAAEKAQAEAEKFIESFGAKPAEYVRRERTMVLLFDDPPPTAAEVKPVVACAGSAG